MPPTRSWEAAVHAGPVLEGRVLRASWARRALRGMGRAGAWPRDDPRANAISELRLTI